MPNMTEMLGPFELGRVHCCDCLEAMKELPDDSVQCVVTSPPYWGLRDYNVDGQIGLEKSPEEYINKMVGAFREVRRVLRPDGTCWVNMGDSYARTGGWSNNAGLDGKSRGDGSRAKTFNNKRPPSLKEKDLCMIPARLAIALQGDGWWLRSDIIWSKPNPMPESVTDRPTSAHEHIFLLTKSAKYFYDADAVREKATGPTIGIPSGWDTGPGGHDKLDGRYSSRKDFNKNQGGGGTGFKGHSGNVSASGTVYNTRNRRNVWTIATHSFPEAHFATFPPKLVEPCVMAGSGKDHIVLDPFAGAGTTLVTAMKLGRRAIGFELNQEYADMANKRIKRETSQEILRFD